MDAQPQRRIAAALGDRVLTVLSVVAATIFLVSAVQSFIVPDQAGARVALKPGTAVRIPGVTWDQQTVTLVLALQADCQPCDESVDFYKDLLASNIERTFRPLVVVPYAPPAGRRQLAAYGLNIENVAQADFAGLGLPGTPAVMLVSPDGRLEKAWVGRLPAAAEDAVFKTLKIRRAARSSLPPRVEGYVGLTAASFTGSSPRPLILDTRSREEFKESHLPGATNIPLDEIAVRLRHEWPLNARTAVFCERLPTCSVYVATGSTPVRGECEVAVDAVKAAGVRTVEILEGTLDDYGAFGLRSISTRR